MSSPRSKVPTGHSGGLVVGEPLRDLIDFVLKVAPVKAVIDVLTDRVRAQNRSGPQLDALALRGELAKPAIQERSGPSLSTAEVGELLEKSDQTIRNRVKANQLVAYEAPGDRTRLRLPLWQFDAKGGVHRWVPALVAAFGTNGWGLVDFVTVPRTSLKGLNYLHLLLNDRSDEVVAAARRSNPD
jgi:hypothetical protein